MVWPGTEAVGVEHPDSRSDSPGTIGRRCPCSTSSSALSCVSSSAVANVAETTDRRTSRSSSFGISSGRCNGSRAGDARPLAPGEPPLGLRPDRRRAAQARDPRRRDDDPEPAPDRASGSRPAADRTELDRVPPGLGERDHRLRLLHRRDGLTADALCPLLHRARQPADPPERLHRAARLGVGHPAGPQPRPEPRRSGRSASTGRSSRGRRHLDRTLRTYAEHDNRARPHRALGLGPIAPSPWRPR